MAKCLRGTNRGQKCADQKKKRANKKLNFDGLCIHRSVAHVCLCVFCDILKKSTKNRFSLFIVYLFKF